MYVCICVCVCCDTPLYDLKDDPIWFDCMRKVDLHKLHSWSFSSVYMQGSSWDSTTSFQTTIQHYCVYARVIMRFSFQTTIQHYCIYARVINLIMRFYNQFPIVYMQGSSWDSTTSFQTTIQHYCVYARVITWDSTTSFQPCICKGHHWGSTTMQFPNDWTMHRNFSQIPFLS